MVKLTIDLIARGTSGYTKKKRDESFPAYLKRLTHLYLEGKNIDDVGEDLAICRNLSVLYLYDNKLCSIPNLNQNIHITHLYVQNNSISRLDNLHCLRRLTKLFIGGNQITVLEGLEKLSRLQELHIENQKLPIGEKLLMDPRTIQSLSESLLVLNVSGNSLDSVTDLQALSKLNQFLACDNHLGDFKELAHCFSSWSGLWRLELLGNPLCHKSKYRDRVIVMAPTLEVLDGKEISATTKQFLLNMAANKEKRRRERSGPVNYESGDLPPVSAPAPKQSLEKVNTYVMPALPRRQFQEVLARSMSQPNSAIQPRTDPDRVYSDITQSRYLNSYGTFYHARIGAANISTPPLSKVNLGQ